jgi:NAD(P)-dependent dehydrogenase (short-subunit alcohol dehydrogenase family)
MFQANLLKGKKILVTGGGTGLGKEMALAYAKLGAETVICGRRESVLQETAKEIEGETGAKCTPIACDIRVAQAIQEMVDEVWTSGPLTGLVNNAAGNFISRTKDLSPRGFDAIANIVFHGTFYMTHAVGKKWIEGGHKGSIINILTTWVWNGSPYVVPSAMSKAAVGIMGQSLSVEWGPHGIRINSICPGAFPTEGMTARLNPGQGEKAYSDMSGNPWGRVGQMEELTNLATFLMADGCDYLTGQTIAIDGAQYQATGGNFSRMASLTDADWESIRGLIKGANEKDKAKRVV